MHTISKIISGGQTGADRAALDVAIWHRFPHGGWCPKGRKAEDGCIATGYSLKETPRADYLQRTEWNARDSDATVVFTFESKIGGGSLRTVGFAQKHQKPCLHIHRGLYQPELLLQKFIIEHSVSALNVAGSRESKEPGIYEWVKRVLDDALFWSDRNPSVLGGPGEG